MLKKKTTFHKNKWIFGHFLCFFQNHKNGQKSIFFIWKVIFFFNTQLNNFGKHAFHVFWTFQSDQRIIEKDTFFCFDFAHFWPFFNFDGPKVPQILIFIKSELNIIFYLGKMWQLTFYTLFLKNHFSGIFSPLKLKKVPKSVPPQKKCLVRFFFDRTEKFRKHEMHVFPND